MIRYRAFLEGNLGKRKGLMSNAVDPAQRTSIKPQSRFYPFLR